jgi:hypothetical protein
LTLQSLQAEKYVPFERFVKCFTGNTRRRRQQVRSVAVWTRRAFLVGRGALNISARHAEHIEYVVAFRCRKTKRPGQRK